MLAEPAAAAAGSVDAAGSPARRDGSPPWWLFSPRVDLAVFLGSAVLSLLALALGAALGLLEAETPDWAWITLVLVVDIAHVWTTVFRTYTDPAELRKRPWLYTLAPLVGYVAGVWLYAKGPLVFWRVLAYIAVFHFVRQQYGWVALYRARRGERDLPGRLLDQATVYMACIYPIVYWHAHLPRRFWWFVPDDFSIVPPGQVQAVLLRLSDVGAVLFWGLLGLYAVRSLVAWRRGRGNPGKDIVVVTTAVCWYVGIVVFNSDYAFTVTNVLIHGIPYIALLYYYGRWKYQEAPESAVYGLFAGGPAFYLGIIWLIGFCEELLWDRGVWHQRSWFFGAPWSTGEHALLLLVPLLALPQLVHYVLDGFVWRRGASDGFVRALFSEADRGRRPPDR